MEGMCRRVDMRKLFCRVTAEASCAGAGSAGSCGVQASCAFGVVLSSDAYPAERAKRNTETDGEKQGLRGSFKRVTLAGTWQQDAHVVWTRLDNFTHHLVKMKGG